MVGLNIKYKSLETYAIHLYFHYTTLYSSNCECHLLRKEQRCSLEKKDTDTFKVQSDISRDIAERGSTNNHRF